MTFQELRWQFHRWTPRHAIYRARLPMRRRAWLKERETVCRPFSKRPDARPTRGPALVVGEFSGKHGLGRGAAYDVAMLQGLHSEVQTFDTIPYLKGAPAKPLASDRPIENLYLFCQPDTYDTVFRLMNERDIANAYRVGRWVWETPIFPTVWRFAEDLVHEVWTPSEFCAETFRKALSIPVAVKPHLVSEPQQTDIDMRARLGIPNEAFMGLAVMDIQSCPERKNPWAHVRAWRHAFGDDASAILALKVRVGKRTSIVLDELRDIAGKATNIRLVSEDLEDLEIAALHRATDVYLSLHRSEGFGLNIYEALLLGKPVIATDWSANSEYGPSFPNYRGVTYELVPYHDWMKHYEERDFRWAEASIPHASSLLKQSRRDGSVRAAR